jgi:hypothetical protein
MAIDVALEVLSDPDFLIDLTVERRTAGVYTDGLYVPGTASSLTIPASVQPANAEDFQNLPEGERFGGSQLLYTLLELVGSKDLAKADKVINYLGVNWKIVHVEPWAHHGYFKSIMVKIDGN